MNRFTWTGAIALFTALALLTPAAHARGTASGTTISNVATIGASNASDTTTAPSTDTSMTSVYGDTTNRPADASFAPGETTTFNYSLTNNGNATDSFSIWIGDTLLMGGASGWYVTLTVGSNTTALTNDTKVIASLAADAISNFSVSIYSSSVLANSPDGASESFTIRIASTGSPNYAQYTGDNGTTYATGGSRNADSAIATISAARFTLTKSIDSVALAGLPSAPVPGATIRYKITYDSVGTATPTNIILRDSIPANTTFDTASWKGDTLGSLATFHATDSTAGWVLQYSTLASPTQTFGSGDYTTALPAGTIRWIRWVRTTLPIADKSRNLYFRVIVQ